MRNTSIKLVAAGQVGEEEGGGRVTGLVSSWSEKQEGVGTVELLGYRRDQSIPNSPAAAQAQTLTVLRCGGGCRR